MSPGARAPIPARVAIVGGGYSGAAVAVQLSRAAGGRVAITLVEPREQLGRGIAYSTGDPDHRLNGPLDNHLLDPANPQHLREWCEREGVLRRDPQAHAPNGAIYLRRGDFGAYLDAAIREAGAGNGTPIRHHRSTATALHTVAGGMQVLTADGARIEADLVVIATGNGASRLPGAFARLEGHPALVENPFDARALDSIRPGARVLLVGSGLTALDVISTLLRRSHGGGIHALSRHGVRPRPPRAHLAENSPAPLLARIDGDIPAYVEAALAAGGLRALVRALRQRIGEATRAGGDWQVPFDEVRNVVWQVWPRTPLAQKRAFLRHLRTWYDAHRFRAPPQNDALVREGERAGKVEFHVGRLRAVQAAGQRVRVRWEDRATRIDGVEEFDAVVNCSGLDPACGARDNPFLASLVAQGLLRADPTGLGFAVDWQCRPLGAGARPSGRLRIVGPPTAGTFGDPLGVIFIAPQIRRMLPGLLSELGVPTSGPPGR